MKNIFENIDCQDGLSLLSEDYVHAIITDVPYGISIDTWDVLHANTNSALLGTSEAQQKYGKVFAKRGKPINGWSGTDRNITHEYQTWCGYWGKEIYRVLKPGGSAMIFAGRRFSARCIVALEDCGFLLKDQIAWIKPSAPHRAQRLSAVFNRRGDEQNASEWEDWRLGNLAPKFEPILWFIKPYKQGTAIADNVITHKVGAFNDSILKSKGCANIIASSHDNEIKIHPTQKPVNLMETLIHLITREKQIVLDPFTGSGSTLVAAKNLNRQYIGYEINPQYYALALKRLKNSIGDSKKV